MWLITKYHCDENGRPYGEAFQSECYSQELMESYKNPKFVVAIQEKIGAGQYKTIWQAA
jgi:hypothetical protein